MLAAYTILDDALASCDPTQDTGHEESAAQTLALWRATRSLPDVAMMVVKSASATSLGFENGGLIIEGDGTLNIGLMRASTRALAPLQQPHHAAPVVPNDDRFRRTFWAVLDRLNGIVFPRCFQFFMGGVEGSVHVANGTLWFTGDFLTPADFIGELQAACDVGEEVKYKLLPAQPAPDVSSYRMSELLDQVKKTDGDGGFTFDTDGWPVCCGDDPDVDIIQSLSAMASASGQMAQHSGLVSISVFSDRNRPLVKGQMQSDGTVEFHVQ